MQTLLRQWQRRLLKIIINPAMAMTWVFGVWMILIHVYGFGWGWRFLAQPWMATKLLAVVALSGWHGFLSGELKRIASGSSSRSGRFWRMTNEIPFLIAIVAVLSVTTQWSLA
jgi:putative membrane protein